MLEKQTLITTSLTVKQIQNIVANYFDTRKNIIVPNVSFGLLPYEADMLILNKSGYLTEVEIKRSWNDFVADFKKKHSHDSQLVKYFYYAIPEFLTERVVEFMRDKKLICGFLVYNEDGYIKSISRCGDGRYHRRLFLEEQLKLARLGCIRIWKNN